MTTHKFVESHVKGKVGESILSAFFVSKGYGVQLANLEQQKEEHWDLRLIKPETTDRYVEVKTEYKAETTGNVFWEMEVNGRRGWTQLYSNSELNVVIAWLLPTSRTTYLLKASRLAELTEVIKYEFGDKKREVYNTSSTGKADYISWGYLVPLTFLSKYAKKFKL
jgi:hypothetical protein